VFKPSGQSFELIVEAIQIDLENISSSLDFLASSPKVQIFYTAAKHDSCVLETWTMGWLCLMPCISLQLDVVVLLMFQASAVKHSRRTACTCASQGVAASQLTPFTVLRRRMVCATLLLCDLTL
jgi:hypothetical protein